MGGFHFRWLGFIFGGMGFRDQWMDFIFGGVGGWASSFLGSVVVVFVGWWQLRWIGDRCGFQFVVILLFQFVVPIWFRFVGHLWVLFGADFNDIVGLVWVRFC